MTMPFPAGLVVQALLERVQMRWLSPVLYEEEGLDILMPERIRTLVP